MKSETKQKRLRSPGYPIIDLSEAIQRAKILWDKDKSNPIPKEVSYAHLGYKSTGGYVGRVIAALKHFGLISESRGDIILTQDGIDLAIHEPSDKHYIDIVSKIALKPAIYRKIYEEYNGNIPSDATLKVKLIKDYNFHPDKIVNFTNNFRSTILFAQLEGAIAQDEVEIEEDVTQIGIFQGGTSTEMKSTAKSHLNMKITAQTTISYPIPLSDGENAAIMFSSLPVKKKDIEGIKKWLDFYEDNLTDND